MNNTTPATYLDWDAALATLNVAAIDAACLALPVVRVWEV